MQQQHIENLFRRFKGQSVNVKTVSGGFYEGRVTEVTNDYVCLSEVDGADVYLFFNALESMVSAGGHSR
ncbi:MAG TPA: hypothetical protein VLA93_12765 [Pyrinomonadaceae bacterium]|nr:hypothetical protein [Pyrinomonadaceae bacterium]